MKKIFVSALFAIAFSGAAFATGNETISKQIRQSFEKEFAGAQYVNWESFNEKDLYHATFVLNNVRLNAYFDKEGQLLATGRFVKQESLPMLVSKAITEKYKKQSVVEVIEFVTGNETSYIVKLQDDEKQLYVQAYYDGSTAVLKKSKINK